MLLLAFAALSALSAASPAAADSSQPHFTQAQVIQLVASEVGVTPLLDTYPGAYWTAVYHPKSGQWTATLLNKSGKRKLARFTVNDGLGTVLRQSLLAKPGPPRLNADKAYRIALAQPALRSWLKLYTKPSHSSSLGDDRVWTVSFYNDGQSVAEVHVPDNTGKPNAVWTGPQVGWQMTRGLPDAYGRKVASSWVLIPLCLLFIGGLMNWRRPFSLRTLDLAMLVSFAVSVELFNRGDIFWSTPLFYPPMIYLAVRMIFIGFGHRPRGFQIGEKHMLVLIGLIFALMGFRLGLNNQDSNVIDVGYASVAGASRIIHGTVPYGHMPRTTAKPCGGRYSNGDAIGYVQSDHRCESPVENGDTYGPALYLSYVPAVAALGWSGRWDSLEPAHVTASVFDVLAVLGLLAAGWRLHSPRTGVMLAFGWAANPFTAYSLNMNSNDAVVGAAVAWLLAMLSLPVMRGILLAVAGLTKAGPLALVPLFLSLRGRLRTGTAFVLTSLALISVVLLDSNGLWLLWDRTIDYQANRVTPMSIWTLGSFHPGWPDLHWLQQAAQVAVAIGVCLLAIFPRGRKDAVAVAALGGAAMIGVQLVASYWFYPYICWWLPLALAGLLMPRQGLLPQSRPPLAPPPAVEVTQRV